MSDLKQRIFISYAGCDRTVVDEIRKELKGFERQQELSVWEDHAIVVGQSWADSISTAINRCTVALLVITKSFLASDFIYKEEVRKLLERHGRGEVVVAPVFAQPSAVDTTEFEFEDHSGNLRKVLLTEFQGFRKQGNDPDTTLEELRGALPGKRDRVLTNIGKEIKNLWPPSVPRPWKDETGWPFVWLPGGTFRMGSPDTEVGRFANEGPMRQVTLDPFVIGRTLVTQAQWSEFAKINPSRKIGPTYPVECVSWLEAIRFCNTLSRKWQIPEAYSIHGDNVEAVMGSVGYRLPTEAEWEYAARAGTQTAYFFGNNPGDLEQFAWCKANSKPPGIRPVRERRCSPWGLWDVYGNVWEWCWDRYSESYDPQSLNNPKGPSSGRNRVCRGGSSWYTDEYLRSAYRNNWVSTDGTLRTLGFRVCRSSPASMDL